MYESDLQYLWFDELQVICSDMTFAVDLVGIKYQETDKLKFQSLTTRRSRDKLGTAEEPA